MKRRAQRRLLWGSLILSAFLLTGCGDDIKSASGGGDTGGAAAAAIELSGGSGDPAAAAAEASTEAIASGGSCGYIDLESYGDLRILSDGTVDASFTVPEIENDFGELHYTVSGDETVEVDPEGPVTGLVIYGSTLYLDDGDNLTDPEEVTGLTVPAGATLRISASWVYVWLNNDIVINGTVTTTDEETSIDLETNGNIVIGDTGVITTEASTPGNYGGDIYLYAEGMAINRGSLITDGADGGDAGYVEIDADGDLYNTGTLSSNGGDNAEGAAGSSYGIYLYSYYGSVYTSGTLTARGGSATNGDGGYGGVIEVYAGYDEPDTTIQLVVSGVLQNDGGDAENGNGGDAYDYIDLENYGYGAGSNVVINAQLSSRGGNAVGGNGGDGYDVYVWAVNGGARITGSIDVSGGDGLYGGQGGWIEVYTDGAGQPLEMVGFESIAMDGGDGDSGGTGGDVYLYTYDSWDGESNLPAGAIEIDTPISVNGGTGTVSGGSGGYIYIETSGTSDETSIITNTAPHSAAGGDGTIGGGGDGGDIYFGSSGGPTVDTATEEHDVSGGTGDEPGLEGSVEYNDGPWT
jgi:hypothetical protein